MSTTAALDYTGSDPAFTMGNRIAKRRRDLGYQQGELALRVGVSRPLISKWERDVSIPDVEQAKQLARVLDCSFGWLCGVDPRSRCSSTNVQAEDPADGVDAIHHPTRQVPGQRMMALAGTGV